MKPLNRPMFRYGGPIKEGVMSGIREPKKNGGSMGPNEGPRRAALVGENNNDILMQLGFSSTDIAAMKEKDIIGDTYVEERT